MLNPFENTTIRGLDPHPVLIHRLDVWTLRAAQTLVDVHASAGQYARNKAARALAEFDAELDPWISLWVAWAEHRRADLTPHLPTLRTWLAFPTECRAEMDRLREERMDRANAFRSATQTFWAQQRAATQAAKPPKPKTAAQRKQEVNDMCRDLVRELAPGMSWHLVVRVQNALDAVGAGQVVTGYPQVVKGVAVGTLTVEQALREIANAKP